MSHIKSPGDAFGFPESEDVGAGTQHTHQNAKPNGFTGGMNADHSKALREVHGANREHAVKEVCPKCRGRGRFVSYAGRDCGSCFACKGEGYKYFATSAEHRTKVRKQVADRKAAKQQAALEAFKAAHPDVWAWMDGNTFPVAQDMLARLTKWGSISDNTIAAARRMIAKRDAANAAAAARIENAPEISIDKLAEAFGAARSNGLKRIKVRFAGLEVSEAKATSKNAGSLYVKADGEYVGRITSGRFICTKECASEIQDRVIATMADPKAAAIAYGKQTGSCSCCGRELTNEESIAAGIGPICARKFGWGEP